MSSKEKVSYINPYLFDLRADVVCAREKPLCANTPTLMEGGQANENGNFLMTDSEKIAFIEKEPKAEKFIKPFINGKGYVSNEKFWVLWLKDVELSEYSDLPTVMDRVQKVKEYRAKSVSPSTRRYPYHHLFKGIAQPSSDYLLIPKTTSENRDYIPMGFFTKDHIVNNSCDFLSGATLYHFGILQSAMHMAWARGIGGRCGDSYRYSVELIYNNFPWPKNLTAIRKQKIEAAAQQVLDARAAHPGATIVELYNPSSMPSNLLQAHANLDDAADKAYGKEIFNAEDEWSRIKFLFNLYHEYLNNEPKQYFLYNTV